MPEPLSEVAEDMARLENGLELLLILATRYSHEDKIKLLNIIDNLCHPTSATRQNIIALTKQRKPPKGETSDITGAKG